MIALPSLTSVRASRRQIALIVICLGQLMNTLDSTVVNVALPAIQRSLHFSAADLTWVINAYLITFASFLLLAGRLGDLVGRKRVFLVGVVIFTVASGVCALAQDQAVLIVARLVQGVGGAVSSSVIVAIIVGTFAEPAARARAMSVYTFVAVSGGSIGLLVGGSLTQAINWHWIFLINLPVGLVAFLLGALLIEENDGLGLRHGVDVAGAALITLALATGVYALVGTTTHGWLSPQTLGLGAAALILLVAFLVLQARLANPLMPLHVLRLGGLAGSSVVRALVAVGLYTTFFVGTLYLERVLSFSPTQAGLAFLPQTLCTAVLSLGLSPRLVRRFGPRPVALGGLAALLVGLAILSRAGIHAVYLPELLVAFLLLGAGVATTFMPLLTIGMADVPRHQAGLASGIVNVSMQVAGVVAVAAMGTLAADRTRVLREGGESLVASLSGSYSLGFTVAAGCAVAAILVTLVTLRGPRVA